VAEDWVSQDCPCLNSIVLLDLGPRSKKALILAITAIVVVVATGSGEFVAPTEHVSNVSSSATANARGGSQASSTFKGSITIPAGRYHTHTISLPSGWSKVSVSGSFGESGGSGNDIEVFVVSHTSFLDLLSGHRASSYYSSGRVSSGTFGVTLLSSGDYDVIYSNTFSTFSSKNVQIAVNLYYA